MSIALEDLNLALWSFDKALKMTFIFQHHPLSIASQKGVALPFRDHYACRKL
jgi:hypothetical protein